MDECFEMATKLGEMVRESEASMRLADASAAYEANPDALSEYQRAEAQYLEFAEDVVEALRTAIFGAPHKCGGCGGGCGGCHSQRGLDG